MGGRAGEKHAKTRVPVIGMLGRFVGGFEMKHELAKRQNDFDPGSRSLPLHQRQPNKHKMREVISIHLGQCGVQCGNACWELYCLVRARALEPIARDPRASPRWPAPPARALPPSTHILARRTRPPRARASRRPLAIPLYTSISQPPQPTRLRVPASFPSCLLVSHLARSRAAPSTGARHPARRPDALGQDDWRRR